MSRGRRPEEFFEVFREVQETKKRQEETAEHEAEPGLPEPPTREEPAMKLADREPFVDRLGAFFARTVTVSYTVIATFFIASFLLILAAYMLGKQAGWSSHEAAVGGRPRAPIVEPKGEAASDAPVASGPELVDGKVFTLLTGDRTATSRQSVEKEVEYLNRSSSFTRLGFEAYVYRDQAGRYRLAARGLAGMDASRRKAAIEAVARLKSSRGRNEYSGAALYAP